MSMPLSGLIPFLRVKNRNHKRFEKGVNALKRANTISINLMGIDLSFRKGVSMPLNGLIPFLQKQKDLIVLSQECVNALKWANVISTPIVVLVVISILSVSMPLSGLMSFLPSPSTTPTASPSACVNTLKRVATISTMRASK